MARVKLSEFLEENKHLSKGDLLRMLNELQIFASNKEDAKEIKIDNTRTDLFDYTKGRVGSSFRTSCNNYLYFGNVYVEVTKPSTLEKLQNELESVDKIIAKYKANRDLITNKIAFVTENNLDTFDENEFKVFQVLKQLNTNSSDIEKAKAIASLINSK